ncbi:MAG: hypothetical protein Q9166_005507 [cf. Caloplaca sp. 2 TL-2023]
MRAWKRYKDVIAATWHLGFTAFGGPAVQFQTFHQIFVEDHGWISEAMYQQIFAISQALPGSGSAKMLYCINAVHGGLFAGALAFAFFCLPGAIGMYGLSVGISHIGDTLPVPVYALLSGLNAATVGIIALAALNLASRAITDKLTRVLVFLGGALGMLYTALWYYPVIMVGAGLATMIWDLRWLQKTAQCINQLWRRSRGKWSEVQTTDLENRCPRTLTTPNTLRSLPPQHSQEKPLPGIPNSSERSNTTETRVDRDATNTIAVPLSKFAIMPIPATTTLPTTTVLTFPSLVSWRVGTILLILFSLSFIAILLLRALLPGTLPRAFSLFSSLYLAGTIIFGGGPVVIPLLREYIVTPGWVSPRDFLLGLAIIQSFPGPNFNFAVYLGALATKGSSVPSFVGALIAFVAIFTPGLVIVFGFLGLWQVLQGRAWFQAILRGVNAGAVGLVFTAVYKLWEIGLVGSKGVAGGGEPLGGDPWLVFITAAAFVGGKWFGVIAPVAILLGGIAGIGRWAIFIR